MERKRYDGLVPVDWRIVYSGKSAQLLIFNSEGRELLVKTSFKENDEFLRLRREGRFGDSVGSVDPFSKEIISDRDFIVLLIETLEQVELPRNQPSVEFYQIVIQHDEYKKVCAMLIDTQGRRYKVSVPLAVFIHIRKPKILLFAKKDVFQDCGEKS